MNIAVLTANGRVIVRPDTTRVKDGEDSYLPEFVNTVEWSPVLYTRIIKSGKSVSPRFAERYFDSFNVGLLLYPSDFIDGSEEGYACASCLDHTSVINLQFFPLKSEENTHNKFVININNIVSCINIEDITSALNRAITEITKYCWLRVGDIAALELAPREFLCDRSGSPAVIHYGYNGSEQSAVKVIL